MYLEAIILDGCNGYLAPMSRHLGKWSYRWRDVRGGCAVARPP